MSSKITTFLIGIIIGTLGMYLSFSPEIAKTKVEQIRMELFSECVESKIAGVGSYEELIFQNVIDCYNQIN